MGAFLEVLDRGFLAVTRERPPRRRQIALLMVWGCLTLAVTTALGVGFALSTTSAALLYLLLVVVLSLTYNFLSSAILSVVAVLCLNYFFVEPRFSFRVQYGVDVLTLGIFLGVAVIITTLARQLRGLNAAHREQTSVLELTQRLQKVQSELAYVSRASTLGELAGSIAHEVNQPLAAIVTNGDTGLRYLRRAPPDLAEVSDVLERMVKDAQRAGEIIHHVRGLTSRSASQAAPIDINQLVTESASLVQGEIGLHKASLQLALAPDLPTPVIDRIEIQQVLINLLLNGLQALRPDMAAPRELVISTCADRDMVKVAVRDTGVGLGDGGDERLFEAFYTTKAGGMGVGLSICRTIISSHGGRIWATSNEDGGATFQFTLPVNGESRAASTPGSN